VPLVSHTTQQKKEATEAPMSQARQAKCAHDGQSNQEVSMTSFYELYITCVLIYFFLFW